MQAVDGSPARTLVWDRANVTYCGRTSPRTRALSRRRYTIRHAVVEWATKGCCTLYYTRADVLLRTPVPPSTFRLPPSGQISPNRPVVRVRHDAEKEEGLFATPALCDPRFFVDKCQTANIRDVHPKHIYYLQIILLDRIVRITSYLIFYSSNPRKTGYRVNGIVYPIVVASSSFRFSFSETFLYVESHLWLVISYG